MNPFKFDEETIDFEKAFQRDTAEQLDIERRRFLPDQSIQSYKHGQEWRVDVETGDGMEEETGIMQQHSVETTVLFDDIMNNDLSILGDLQTKLVSEFIDGLKASVYQAISDSTEKSGNIVDAKGAGISAKHFLEMLEKIEFGVDHNGEVSLPEIHGSEQVITQLLGDLSKQDSEFESKVESIKKRKIKEALDRENARLSKFPKASN